MQDWAKEHDLEWGFHLPYNLQAAELVERKQGILKQQIKLLTGKTSLTGCTEILFQALIHLHDQTVGLDAPYLRLGKPAETPNALKVWKLWEKAIAPNVIMDQSTMH